MQFATTYRFRLCSAVLLLLGCLAIPAIAERPAATRLLPRETFVVVRIPDAKELYESSQQTALGRMAQDEQIRPLLEDLYGSAAEAYSEVEDEVGASLADILGLPQGEVVFAIVPTESGPPALVVIMDVGEKAEVAEKLVARGEEALREEGATRTTEKHGDVEIVVHQFNTDEQRTVAHFLRDETVVAASEVETAKALLTAWDTLSGAEAAAAPISSLADNSEYAAIMHRCRGKKDERPHLMWYANVIPMIKASTRGNIGAQAGLAMLPTLGLDGLHSMGGSLTFATEQFDVITHLHVLLDHPRRGVIKMIALRPGDMTPEPWVPADAASYLTLHWDVQTAYNEMAKLYDSFFNDGAWSNVVKTRVSDNLGMDIENDLIPALDGRFTHTTWIEKPANMDSRVPLFAFKLNDADSFESALEKLVEKFKDNLEEKEHGGVAYWQVKREEPTAEAEATDADSEDETEDQPPRRRRFRRPQPCMAILGDYLVMCPRANILEQAISAKNAGSASLADQLDFKLIASRIKRDSRGGQPAMLLFDRPEEGMRMLYDIATNDDNRTRWAERAEENQFFAAINGAFNDHPLPPFEVISKYLAPGGGSLTSDESGLHYVGFSLKRQ